MYFFIWELPLVTLVYTLKVILLNFSPQIIQEHWLTDCSVTRLNYYCDKPGVKFLLFCVQISPTFCGQYILPSNKDPDDMTHSVAFH